MLGVQARGPVPTEPSGSRACVFLISDTTGNVANRLLVTTLPRTPSGPSEDHVFNPVM